MQPKAPQTQGPPPGMLAWLQRAQSCSSCRTSSLMFAITIVLPLPPWPCFVPGEGNGHVLSIGSVDMGALGRIGGPGRLLGAAESTGLMWSTGSVLGSPAQGTLLCKHCREAALGGGCTVLFTRAPFQPLRFVTGGCVKGHSQQVEVWWLSESKHRSPAMPAAVGVSSATSLPSSPLTAMGAELAAPAGMQGHPRPLWAAVPRPQLPLCEQLP